MCRLNTMVTNIKDYSELPNRPISVVVVVLSFADSVEIDVRRQ